jgi:hypothetical protein
MQPALRAQPHQNQQLFSDYYLNEILARRPEWQMLAADAAPVMQEIGALLASYTPTANEAQTEEHLVRPILRALGHTFEVQVPLKTPGGTKKPDYVFYRDEAALAANRNQVLTDQLAAGRVLAVGDAKHWDRSLDVALKGREGDPFSNRNPSYQIAFYMQHSAAPWGILTNGRLWRLYHHETAHKLDRYYEVDLPALLATDDKEAFLYFYTFFHRRAFDEGPLSVARILAASTEFAGGVSETLKRQVYDALRHLAQGFLDYPPNRLSVDPPTLKAIYDNSLIILYRLLFILYAEARELLPVQESEAYRRAYSLYAIKNDVARSLTLGPQLLPSSGTLWPRLMALFGLIHAGSPPLRVATFNGGLFDPQRHPFLTNYWVGDAHLQQAIDRLARVAGQFIDYRDLEIRHLGTIYEGLLEYHLEPLVEAAKEDEGFTVALLNDKGERKITGSYYTPDFVVKYIVQETVGPALKQALESASDDAARVAAVLGVNVGIPPLWWTAR